jgi:hypothetical protein
VSWLVEVQLAQFVHELGPQLWASVCEQLSAYPEPRCGIPVADPAAPRPQRKNPTSQTAASAALTRFQALRADGILDRSYGAYRASHIALYSSFMRDEPPTGSL